MADELTDQIFSGVGEEEVDTGSLYEGDEPAPKEEWKEDKYTPPTKARTSGEQVLNTAFFGLGYLLVSRQIDPPVGRTIQFEAPLAAQAIDKAIAGTFIDRILQPLFNKSEQLEGLGAILALPVMVGLYERKPALAPILEPAMLEVVGIAADELVPVMRKHKAKARRNARSLSELTDAFDIPKGTDPRIAILGSFFRDVQPEEGQPQPPTEGETEFPWE